MPRRGQCRCGAVLTVTRTAEGYKQRCPACNAIVRIRSRHKKRKAKQPPPPPLVPTPAVPAVSPFDVPIPLHAPLNPQPKANSVPTLEPWTEPAPRRLVNLWIVAAVLVLVLALGGVIGWLLS